MIEENIKARLRYGTVRPSAGYYDGVALLTLAT